MKVIYMYQMLHKFTRNSYTERNEKLSKKHELIYKIFTKFTILYNSYHNYLKSTTYFLHTFFLHLSIYKEAKHRLEKNCTNAYNSTGKEKKEEERKKEQQREII